MRRFPWAGDPTQTLSDFWCQQTASVFKHTGKAPFRPFQAIPGHHRPSQIIIEYTFIGRHAVVAHIAPALPGWRQRSASEPPSVWDWDCEALWTLAEGRTCFKGKRHFPWRSGLTSAFQMSLHKYEPEMSAFILIFLISCLFCVVFFVSLNNVTWLEDSPFFRLCLLKHRHERAKARNTKSPPTSNNLVV